MKSPLFCLLVLLLSPLTLAAATEAPLRVFIRSGPKTHGPGAHDYPRFLREWVALLNERGALATGADAFPTREQLEATDVLVLHAQEAGNIPASEDRTNLQAFLHRGGGLVVLHAGAVSRDPVWFRDIVGGSWRHGTTRWLEGPMHLYLTDRDHPILRDCSNWSMEDEIYYDLDLHPDIRVLAAAYTPKPAGARSAQAEKRAEELTAGGRKVSIYDIQPQMWTYERTLEGASRPYRAFVSLPGHLYENFQRPNYRAILLRGLAWAGQRANLDELCRPEELGDHLRYPAGGPTRPEAAAALIEVHPEFNLSLVAAEPLIQKVMNLDWDEQGRLWVSETPEYPNGRRPLNAPAWKDTGTLDPRPDRPPEDRISVLIDTDGDGRMDRKQVFADRLELVTGFCFYRNGVIVSTAPDIWWLEDTDGDLVADRRTKLYTGLGTRDTHAVINNLRWGLDGWIYATHGYSHGEVTSPDGTKIFGLAGSGVVRFRPDGSAFEQYSSRSGNTWGLDITWDGQVFWTQPTSGTVLFHTVLPEYVLAQGKLAGTTSWKGLITGQKTYPLMTHTDQAYVQIDQVGYFTAAAGCALYDGGAWPKRWRYSYFTGEPTVNLVHHQFVRPAGVSYVSAKEPGREETEFIRSRDLWFRPIETRVGPDGALYIVDFYTQAVIHNDTRGPQHGPANAAVRPDRDHTFGRIWRVHHRQARLLDVPRLDRRDLAGLQRTIATSPNAHVKHTAWRLMREDHGASDATAAARPMGSPALALFHRAQTLAAAGQRREFLDMLARADDAWTKSALVAAAREHAAEFAGDLWARDYGESGREFLEVLLPAVPAEAVAGLVERAADAKVPTLSNTLLRALAQRPEARPALSSGLTRALRALLADPATQAAVLPVLARWDPAGSLADAVAAPAAELLRELLAPATTDERRAAIATGLLALPSHRSEALAQVATLLQDARTSEPLKASLLAALGADAAGDVSQTLVMALTHAPSAKTLDAILRRPAASLLLLGAIEDGRIAPAALGPGALTRLRTHPDREVAHRAAALLTTLSPETPARDELITRLLPAVNQPGDVGRGRELFAAACAVCHRFGDLGTRDVGPPLAGMGAHGTPELLAHIIDPQREVDPSFWQWNVTTRQGETLAGVIVSENATSLTLRHQGGDSEVPKTEIARRENTRRSLMPEGFEGLGAEGLRDLLAFMRSAEPAAPSPSSPAATPAAKENSTGPKEGGPGDAPLPPTQPIVWGSGKAKVLLIGGGSSHQFDRFFNATDRDTLQAAGFAVQYTEDRDQAVEALAEADVAVISVNRRFFPTPAYRRALLAFADAGKGIVWLHAGTWYAYPEWPEVNAQLVGGGTRSHDRLGSFEVHVRQPEHPLMRGLPARFEVVDELYHMNADAVVPAGAAAITVLAETSPSQKYHQPHPAVWITEHPRARLVGITLGHDGRTHDLPAFKTLLGNAVQWASGDR